MLCNISTASYISIKTTKTTTTKIIITPTATKMMAKSAQVEQTETIEKMRFLKKIIWQRSSSSSSCNYFLLSRPNIEIKCFKSVKISNCQDKIPKKISTTIQMPPRQRIILGRRSRKVMMTSPE